MQLYCDSLTAYQRLKTREVKVGDLLLGNLHPIRIQTMTTTDTMDTKATVEQSIRCIEAGAELIRITAPSKKEAENLQLIKKELHRQGYRTPLVADIHFTPNAAEIAARIVEKVRINPGNYIDKKKFEFIEYTDADYLDEIARIRERFTPLVMICKEYGTAMRIGTNHGSLSDRIMSRYGDTPMGMVESAMEFLRVARGEQFHQIMLSMKSSNPQVMVQAYRLLIRHMMDEFGECYPLHLGVTEAGDGEDGRIKSAVGIGTLMEDGIGDTIRVSLTEDPEFEIPVCKDLVKKYSPPAAGQGQSPSFNIPPAITVPYNPFSYCRRPTRPVFNIGGKHVPIVVADFSHTKQIDHQDLASIGYDYEPALDKWTIRDGAADFIYLGQSHLPIALPGSLQVFCDYGSWRQLRDKTNHFPFFEARAYLEADQRSAVLNLVSVDCAKSDAYDFLLPLAGDQTVVMSLHASGAHPILAVRRFIMELMNQAVAMPILLQVESRAETIEEQLVQFSAETGELLLDGMGDGIWLINEEGSTMGHMVRGRTYLETKSNAQFLNNTAFSILQATRTRISKTEYISCPSCGRTLFDLQLTTARIRSVTNHLKGVKIAIMGCIVNGPGEMADADFGYVGSGPGKITLYRGKEVVKRSINSETAVDELIDLIKESDQWVNP